MSVIDPDALCGALRVTRKGLAEALRPELEAAYADLAPPAKMAARCAKMAPRWAKMAPKRAKMTLR